MSEVLERLRLGLADRYAVDREIGSGGMAQVFLADDVRHRRKVAIKVLRPELGSVIGGDRFLREIEILARLTHPHVLPLHDSGEQDGLLYYVMPYVEGESLRDRLRRTGTIPLRDTLRIGKEVADALAYAHKRGIVHRDIKPENILLSEGHALVADFGIARAVSTAGGERLTNTGVALGTLHYMSPEQALTEEVDDRSDIYSLGCVLFEMLTGHPPLQGATARAVMAQLAGEGAPSLAATAPAIPRDVARVVDTALAAEPSDRFASAEDLARELTRIGEQTTLSRRQPKAGRTSRALRHWIAAGAVLLVAIAAWSAVHSRTGAPERVTGSSNRIAVLPFTVHGGTQVEYLREGIVDLLSRNLEGVEEVSSIDPATVMSTLRGATSDAALDLSSSRELVRRVGAGSFVLGSVTSAGPVLRLQAALYDAGEERTDPQAVASVEGDSASVLQLVDRLAAQLLVNRRRDPANRLNQTAALTTHSLPALKSFLNAERSLRGRALDSAISGYQRAIGQDSTFALAYYRLAVAAGWGERHALAAEAVAQAVRVGGRLSERDRRLLGAYAVYRSGEPDEAERLYREILEHYPDDIEAEFQLGDLLFQYNPLRGRSRLEARPLFDKVLALDPGFL